MIVEPRLKDGRRAPRRGTAGAVDPDPTACLSTPEVVRSSRRRLRIRLERARRGARGAARRGAAPPKQSIVLTKDDAGGYGSNLPSHYVAAINTDGGYDYGLTTQCGECWEILCVDGRQRGLSDSILGPWAGCVDPAKKSVTVMITDSCPCDHPGNPESNKRWCCGGEGGNRHWDLSYAAFDAIAIRHRGVVDVRYRRTSCDSMGEERYYE